ncbi:MAG TPA: PDZ domain-containing protein [Terriglobales bacterium]|nr:PDZ domain-containing protein [Terriglobales bacterium]
MKTHCSCGAGALAREAVSPAASVPPTEARRKPSLLRPAFILALFLASFATSAHAAAPVYYTVSLANPGAHLLHVTINLAPGADERQLQLPVWNALYQVRDFSQYINWVRAKSTSGQALDVRLLDKSRWSISGARAGAEIQYEIFADDAGPYGAQLNLGHAFFNLAEVLMYPVDQRTSPVQVTFADVPSGWKIATMLATAGMGDFTAESYDQLVDSPVEIGSFQESDFDDGGGHYRVVVDADRSDYDMQKLTAMVRRIVAAATTWMNDRPFQTYLFLYHFPRTPGGGGMEHAYCTAIDVNARTVAEDPLQLEGVTAHEFFHVWNVKRIRPQSLEPVDYTRENYTPSLWFSEGFTSTVEDLILLRAGLLDEKQYLARLASQIGELEHRPAHLTQSAEESSLDAWLEKYPAYGLPERSISYYNKGELLGVILDLALRDATHGSTSLREMLEWMNQNYAHQGRFFADSQGIEQAAETVSKSQFDWFFEKYVAGDGEIPWDDFFSGVGLRVVGQSSLVADLGFATVRNHDEPPIVTQVAAGGKADRAGLAAGDAILEVEGRAAGADYEDRLAQMRPGDTLHLRVRSGRGEHEVHWKLDSREEVRYELRDVDHPTPEQRARRAAWLKGEAQAAVN